jgi:predicted Zn-dependent protease
MKPLLPLLALAWCSACATSPLGRKQLILVPQAQMDLMGAQAFAQMKSQVPTEPDTRMNDYVRCVATPITDAAKSKLKVAQWEIVVFKDDTANAFALPGGKIGVHTGLFKVAKNDAQLAAVLGHEVGHVIARHGAERVSDQIAATGGLIAIGAATKSDNKTMALLGIGAQLGILLPFGRTQESEADLIGLELMVKAGFDPRASVELWHNMTEAGGKGPPEWLSTHPAHESRIRSLQDHMAQAERIRKKARPAPNCSRP